MEDEIVVSGKLRSSDLVAYIEAVLTSSSTSGGAGPVTGGPDGGGGGGSGGDADEPTRSLSLPIPGTNLKLKLTSETWNKLSDGQKYALVQVLYNNDDSNILSDALHQYELKGVTHIELNMGDKGKDYNGNYYDFPEGTVMAITAKSNDFSTTKTDLVAGYPLVISINSESFVIKSGDMKGFANALIHEILHPFVADVYDPNTGQWSDHGILQDSPGYSGLVSNAVIDVFGDIDWFVELPALPDAPGGVDPGGPPDPDPDGPPSVDEPIGRYSIFTSLDFAEYPAQTMFASGIDDSGAILNSIWISGIELSDLKHVMDERKLYNEFSDLRDIDSSKWEPLIFDIFTENMQLQIIGA